MFGAVIRRVWAVVDWRRAAVLEHEHRQRGAAAMLDTEMYDRPGYTWNHPEPVDGEAWQP